MAPRRVVTGTAAGSAGCSTSFTLQHNLLYLARWMIDVLSVVDRLLAAVGAAMPVLARGHSVIQRRLHAWHVAGSLHGGAFPAHGRGNTAPPLAARVAVYYSAAVVGL